MRERDCVSIQVGDLVTIRVYSGLGLKGPEFNQERTGTAVLKGPAGWVLNMGGAHGTPGIADETNVVRVRRCRRKRA